MYKHTLTIANQYLAKNQELPKNTTQEGNGSPLCIGNGLGGIIELIMVAETPCTLPSSSSITLELLESDTEGGNYEKAPVSSTIRSTGEKKWGVGEYIMRLPLSSYGKAFVKASITTSNASTAGTISIIPSYLPR